MKAGAEEAVAAAADEYGLCVIETRGTRPVVTRADARVRIADQIVAGANSMHTPWVRLNGNLLTIVDVTYELVSWDGFCHVGEKVEPRVPRTRRRTRAGA